MLGDAGQGSSLFFEFGRTMAKNALRRSGSLSRPPTAMEPRSHDRVLVTGAAGFIGSAVTRALLARDVRVVGLLEPGADASNLDGLDVERLEVDLRDPDGVERAVRVAGPSSTWPPSTASGPANPRHFYDVNVGGTRNVIGRGPARRAPSASSTRAPSGPSASTGPPAGVRPTRTPRRGRSPLRLLQAVQVRGRARGPAGGGRGPAGELVLPTFPLGPGDTGPTPTGQLVLDYLNGRVPGYVDTVLNVAHVDDVAQGQILALERGAVGRSYILGGENYSLKRLLDTLSSVTGLPPARLRVPRAVALGVARLSEMVEGGLLHRHPSVPLEAARMSTTRMAFDDGRARRELGYAPRPAADALAASARWFVSRDRVVPARRDKIALVRLNHRADGRKCRSD